MAEDHANGVVGWGRVVLVKGDERLIIEVAAPELTLDLTDRETWRVHRFTLWGLSSEGLLIYRFERELPVVDGT